MTNGMATLAGLVVTPTGVVRGRVRYEERILAVERDESAPERWVLPGFIDVHVHGGGGADTMDGPEGVRALARFHARHGTTSILPTTITAPWEAMLGALRGVREAMEGGAGDGAEVLGAHLEGPFVSPMRLGAQPPFDRDATAGLVDEALATGAVRVVTMAPERPGALEAAAAFARAGVRVSVGHTTASYEEVSAFAAVVRTHGGTLGFTHLYNAMGGLQGRAPGAVGAALADEEAFAELILDGHHVHAGSAMAARRALGPRLILVTDAIGAAGTDAEAYQLGGRPISIASGVARTAEGALAGSLLTLDEALRRAFGLGISIPDASHMLSAAPAAYLGLGDRGTIAPGKRADLVELDADLRIRSVVCGGRPLVP